MEVCRDQMCGVCVCEVKWGVFMRMQHEGERNGLVAFALFAPSRILSFDSWATVAAFLGLLNHLDRTVAMAHPDYPLPLQQSWSGKNGRYLEDYFPLPRGGCPLP